MIWLQSSISTQHDCVYQQKDKNIFLWHDINKVLNLQTKHNYSNLGKNIVKLITFFFVESSKNNYINSDDLLVKLKRNKIQKGMTTRKLYEFEYTKDKRR